LNNKKIIYLSLFLILALFIVSSCKEEVVGRILKFDRQPCQTDNDCFNEEKGSRCIEGLCTALNTALKIIKNPNQQTLDVTAFGNGTGYIITHPPSAINCGSYGTGRNNCTGNYNNGTTFSLLGIGISNNTYNSSFYKWSGDIGDCNPYQPYCHIKMDRNRGILAQFYSRRL